MADVPHDAVTGVEVRTGRPTLSDVEMAAVQEGLAGTGFLLEQRVYETCLESGHNTFLGSLWVDGDTGKSRESDVTIRDSHSLGWMTMWCSVVIECKAWTQPVVVIGRSERKYRRARSFDEVRLGNDPLQYRDVDGSLRGSLGGGATWLGLRSLPSSAEAPGFIGTQLVLLERRGQTFKAENGGAFASVLEPLAKATLAEQLALAPDHPDFYQPELVLSFPAVVTSGPIIEAEPGPSGLTLRQVDRTRVTRQFRSSHQPASLIVEVVHESAVAAWLSDRVQAFTNEVKARTEEAADLLEGPNYPLDEIELKGRASTWRSVQDESN